MKTQLPFFKPDNLSFRNVSIIPVAIMTAENNTYITKISVCNTHASDIYVNLKKVKHADLIVPIEIFKAKGVKIPSNGTINLLNKMEENSIFLEDLDSLIISTDGRTQTCDVDVDFLISLENL